MKPFAYIRVSTDEQAEKGNSLNEQQERLSAYCKAMDWEEPEWYIDDGYSAKNTRRPDMTRLLEDVKTHGKEGIVLTTKIDRLSRNLFDLLGLVRFFDKYEFKYVSSQESFDTSTAAGRLTLQVLGMVAEFERERNSERVRDNMLSMAKKLPRKQTISRPCFGYDIINGVYHINIEESINANKAADIVLAQGIRAGVRWLNEQGVLTKDGNKWHERVLREYLQRETLVGDFVYNKTSRKGHKVVANPPEEWIVIEDHHPAIMDRDKHEKLKRIFEANKTIGRRIFEDRYLLSGLVVCGHCEGKMNGKMNRNRSTGPRNGEPIYNYVCSSYLKKATCFHHYIRRDDLEEIIIRRIQEISQSAPGKLRLVVSKPKTETMERDKIIAELAKLDRKFQRQLEAFEDELISKEDLRIGRERIEQQRKVLTERLEAIETGVEKYKQKTVQENLIQASEKIKSLDRLQTKHLLRELIENVIVKNGSEVEIVWRSNL